jgi:hypothetical protein
MANACAFISPVMTVNLRLSRDGNRRHSEASQLRRPAKSRNRGFRVRTYAVLFLTMAVLCLGSLAHAGPPPPPAASAVCGGAKRSAQRRPELPVPVRG